MYWPSVRAVRDGWPCHWQFQCDDSLHFGAFIIWPVGHLKGCWDRWVGMTCKCWYSESWTGRGLGCLLSPTPIINKFWDFWKNLLASQCSKSFVDCVSLSIVLQSSQFLASWKLWLITFMRKWWMGSLAWDRLSWLHGAENVARKWWMLRKNDSFVKQILSWFRLRRSGMLYSLFDNESCWALSDYSIGQIVRVQQCCFHGSPVWWLSLSTGSAFNGLSLAICCAAEWCHCSCRAAPTWSWLTRMPEILSCCNCSCCEHLPMAQENSFG